MSEPNRWYRALGTALAAVLILPALAYSVNLLLLAREAAPLVDALHDESVLEVGTAGLAALLGFGDDRDDVDVDDRGYEVFDDPRYEPLKAASILLGGALLGFVLFVGMMISAAAGGWLRAVGVTLAVAGMIILAATPVYYHRVIDVVSYYKT